MRRGFLMVLVVAVSAESAAAQPAVGPCETAASVEARKDCFAAHYGDLDRLLADTYKRALIETDAAGLGKNLTMDWKRALQETQRKWIAYREADCGPPLTYELAGRPQDIALAQVRCKIAHTESRLAALLARYPTR